MVKNYKNYKSDKKSLKNIILLSLILFINAVSVLVQADVLDAYTKPFPASSEGCSITLVSEWALGGNASNCAQYCNDWTFGCKAFVFYPDAPSGKVNCNVRRDVVTCNAVSANAPGIQGYFYHKFQSSQDFDTGTGQNQTFIYTRGVDCPRSDIKTQSANDVSACAKECLQTSDCVAISFGNGQCSLKRDVETCDFKSGNTYTFYQKYGPPTERPAASPVTSAPVVSSCQPGDRNCTQLIRPDGFNNDKTNMYVYPRITRDKTEVNKTESDTASKVVGDASTAVLLQTSYLARVMVQANDVFPPSHVSTRTSGETYLSSAMPYQYNLKTLAETSLKRSMLGSENFSQNAKKSGEALALVRDWVEQHLNTYCDPLAAKTGIYGCRAPSALSSQQQKNNGTTNWEGWRGNADITFAEDINASTLFESKITHPEAAMRYIYNITDNSPLPLESSSPDFTIPDKYIFNSNGKKILKNEGYSAYMGYLERQAKSSLSQYALMKIFAEHLELSSVKIPVTKWTDQGKVTTYETTSRHGLLEFEATKRFSDPGWYDRVQQMPTPALLKEIAYMQALQLTLEFKRYEQEQLQIAQVASFTAQLAAMANMAREMAKNTDPQKGLDAVGSALSGVGINLPTPGTKVDINAALDKVIQ